MDGRLTHKQRPKQNGGGRYHNTRTNNIKINKAMLVKEFRLAYKTSVPKREVTINNTEQAATECRKIYNKETMNIFESFYVIFVNQANEMKGYMKISEGGMTSCLADLRLIFASALEALATAIIVTHNHPSGRAKPSAIDEQLTKKIKAGCDLLEIQLLDHIIITDDKYYSFVENGLIS